MKFLTLALALLLAVASQAAPTDINHLDHARTVVDMGLTRAKESIKKALAELDGGPYAEQGQNIIKKLDDMHNQLKEFQTGAKATTNQVYETLVAATESFRKEIMADIDTLKADIEPKGENLRLVVEKHINEYRALLDPILEEHHKKNTEEMALLKEKLAPVMTVLEGKVEANVEETKAALLPILDSLSKTLSERAKLVHQAAKPYADEYKEIIVSAAEKVKNLTPDQIATIKTGLSEKGENVKQALTELFATLVGSLDLF